VHNQEDITELLLEVKKIEVLTRGLVRERLGGEYHSSFKGQGIDFDDLRAYQPGDEVRAIDWNTTARLGEPFIKKFVEERELSVFLAIDVSASGNYGSQHHSKRRLAATIAAVFAFSALQNQDKVGLILFSDEVELFIPPKKGSPHVLRLIREILFCQPEGKLTDPAAAFEVLVKNVKRRSLVFMISDFICDGLHEKIRAASVKHDLVAVQVVDPAEAELPRAGRLRMEDPETGEQFYVNTNDAGVRSAYTKRRGAWQRNLDQELRKLGIDKVEVSTDPSVGYLTAIHALFKKRESRRTA
jgi:uncharacterized protein (DUF58 family)